MKLEIRLVYLLFLGILMSFSGAEEIIGVYSGLKDDYITELKLYDDSAFKYNAIREFPFEVSEGTWSLNGDTVCLITTPCTNPDALNRPPVRTYISLTGKKFLHRKNSLNPLSANGKLIRSEIMDKAK
jgi:hypothetical protein